MDLKYQGHQSTGPGAAFLSMIYDPANGNVYVANFYSYDLSVIEGNTNLTKGWVVQGSSLGLEGNVSGSGSLSVTSSNSYSPANSIVLQDGSVLEKRGSVVANKSSLPFVFNVTTGAIGLYANVINMQGVGNNSFSTTNTVNVKAVNLKHQSFTLTEGDYVTLRKGTNYTNALILRPYLLNFTYTIHSSQLYEWDDVFYHTYNASGVSESTIN